MPPLPLKLLAHRASQNYLWMCPKIASIQTKKTLNISLPQLPLKGNRTSANPSMILWLTKERLLKQWKAFFLFRKKRKGTCHQEKNCNKKAEIGKILARTKMSLKLRYCKNQSNPVFRQSRREALSFHHMDHHSWVRCYPSKTRQPPGASSMEGYLRSLGSKLTTTLPETRRAHWIKGIQSISMNLSQCSAETTLRISSWHLSALETILLHP